MSYQVNDKGCILLSRFVPEKALASHVLPLTQNEQSSGVDPDIPAHASMQIDLGLRCTSTILTIGFMKLCTNVVDLDQIT